MLKLTKKVDYGLLAIAYIAENYGKRVVSTREISEVCNIPLELLAKILQKMVKKGLIESISGPKGGYSLSMDPSRISVAKIIEAVEGNLSMLTCSDESANRCYQFDICNIRSPMQKLESRIIELLQNTTIDELIDFGPEGSISEESLEMESTL